MEHDDPTKFTVSSDINGIDRNKEHPEDQTDNPGVLVGPEL